MRADTHALIAGASYLALAARPIATPLGAIGPPLLIAPGLDQWPLAIGLGVGLAAIFGLAPDADRAGSRAARRGGWPTRLAAWTLQRLLGHRGALHSLAVGLLVVVLVGEMGKLARLENLGAIVGWGWFVHIALDALTPRGVPLLWPLGWHLRVPPGIVTGSTAELIFLGAILMTTGWWAFAVG